MFLPLNSERCGERCFRFRAANASSPFIPTLDISDPGFDTASHRSFA